MPEVLVRKVDREEQVMRFHRGEKILVKIIFKVEGQEDLKLLRKLVKGFLEREERTQYIILYKYLDKNQAGGLKRHYGGKIILVLAPLF